MNAIKILLGASSVAMALGLSLPVRAKITTNKITTNKITTNDIGANTAAAHMRAAGKPASGARAGEGAFSAVDAIVLPDGKRLAR